MKIFYAITMPEKFLTSVIYQANPIGITIKIQPLKMNTSTNDEITAQDPLSTHH